MTTRWMITTGQTTPVVVTISANTLRPNVRQLALNAGWNGQGPIILNINAGVDVAHLSVLVGDIPHDVLTINNAGRIGGLMNANVNEFHGVYTTSRIAINNTGTIFGAGGRGGYGGDVWGYYGLEPSYQITGFGGAGGDPAGFYSSNGVTFVFRPTGAWGNAGTYDQYPGAVLGGHEQPWVRGGEGGRGGDLAAAGTSGLQGAYGGTISGVGSTSSSSGSPPGNSVKGNNLVRWISTGTLIGGAVT